MVVDRLAAATAQFSQEVKSKSVTTGAAAKASDSTQTKETTEDTTSFTSSTDSVKAQSKIPLQVGPTRQAKVEALRQVVNSAQYQLDSAKIAQSIANSDI